MSRLWQTGAEWQTTTEVLNSSNWSISTTEHVGSGSLASYRCNAALANGASASFSNPPTSGFATLYTKHDVKINSLPDTGDDFIFVPVELMSTADNSILVRLKMYNDGGVIKVRVEYNAASSQSAEFPLLDEDIFILDSSLLDSGDILVSSEDPIGTGIWFRIETKFDTSPADGSETFEMRINGETIILDNDITFSSKFARLGASRVINNSGSSQTPEVYIDNISVNNAEGLTNNTWIGEEYIAVLKPAAAGDSNAQSGTYADLNEIPAVGAGIVYVYGGGAAAYYRVDDPLTIMDSDDKVNAITVPVYLYGTWNKSYRTGIKSASGGTIQKTANASANNSPTGTTPIISRDWGAWYGRLLLSESDPATSGRWRVTGPNSLSNMQIGVEVTTSDMYLYPGSLGAMVAWSPFTTIPTGGMMQMFYTA